MTAGARSSRSRSDPPAWPPQRGLRVTSSPYTRRSKAAQSSLRASRIIDPGPGGATVVGTCDGRGRAADRRRRACRGSVWCGEFDSEGFGHPVRVGSRRSRRVEARRSRPASSSLCCRAVPRAAPRRLRVWATRSSRAPRTWTAARRGPRPRRVRAARRVRGSKFRRIRSQTRCRDAYSRGSISIREGE